MFETKTYIQRRKLLKEQVKSGLILILGNIESAMNYAANTYHFRQDSNFLYFFGLDNPGFAGLIDVDENKDYIYGDDFTIDDIIWMGPQPTVNELAGKVGVPYTGTPADLAERLNEAISKKRKVHFLPPYRPENAQKIESLLGIAASMTKKYASVELVKAVIAQRSIKSDEEIKEIETALDITNEMYTIAMQMVLPGTYEREIFGRIQGIANSLGSSVSFPIILSVHGETLHNHNHDNILKKNNLLVIDSGAESLNHYAADITRTFPVGGTFTSKQKDIYQIMSYLAGAKIPIVYLSDRVKLFEQIIDKSLSQLPKLNRFLLPGGTETSSRLHLCRISCRTAERRVVFSLKKDSNKKVREIAKYILPYLNRLSDLFFALARKYNRGKEIVT